MNRAEKAKYDAPEALKDILRKALYGKKFRLDCGHHVSPFTVLGNDFIIYNGKELKIICTLCGY